MKNFRYVQKTSAECNEDSYLAILHLSRVELHCKLQEKLHRVTWPLYLSKKKPQEFEFLHKSYRITVAMATMRSQYGGYFDFRVI